MSVRCYFIFRNILGIIRLSLSFHYLHYKFCPPNRDLKALPIGSTWQSFHFAYSSWTKIVFSKRRARICHLSTSENPYFPDGCVRGWGSKWTFDFFFKLSFGIHTRSTGFEYSIKTCPQALKEKLWALFVEILNVLELGRLPSVRTAKVMMSTKGVHQAGNEARFPKLDVK